MRVLRIVSLVAIWSLSTAAPSVAATYSWPVLLSQPITLTNVSLPANTTVAVYCFIGPNGNIPMAAGSRLIPATVNGNGLVSYSGTLTVSVTPPQNTAAPPKSGDVAACSVRTQIGGVQGNLLGNESTLTLP